MDYQTVEQALKQLSPQELEGVLDALSLVVEYARPDPDRGLYLVPPYGELIAGNKQRYIVKPRQYDIIGDWVLVSGKSAYGVMAIGEPSVVTTKEFDDRLNEHCVARKDRLRWWPENNKLWMYPVDMFWPYDSPRGVKVRPGVQTVMESVEFGSKGKHKVPIIDKIPKVDDEAKKRFWDKVKKNEGNGCWIWMGGKNQKGYGRFSIGGKLYAAHRVAYRWSYGNVPKGKLLCHSCNNPSCVRPSHLSPCTDQENTNEAVGNGSYTKGDVITIAERATPRQGKSLDGLVDDKQSANGYLSNMHDYHALTGIKGGPGSGNFGHGGRPGKRGGSSSGNENENWRPVMGQEKSERWASGSVVKATQFHGTSLESAQRIEKEGFSLDFEGAGRVFGDGVYLTSEEDYASAYADDGQTLRIKVNIRNPYYAAEGKGIDLKDVGLSDSPTLVMYSEFASRAAGILGIPRSEAGTAWLKQQGFDAYIVQEWGIVPTHIHPVIVVFDPRNITVIK